MGYNVYSSTRNSSRGGGNRRSTGGGGGYGGGRSNKVKSRFGQYIDPARFVKAANPRTGVDAYVAQYTFNDFDVHPTIKANIVAKGYVTPSPIQDQTIPHGLAGKDVIGIANTGTGKTAAFSVPALHKIMSDKASKMLIIAPTRELAQQIEDECRSIAKGSGLSGALLIGGSSMGIQLRDLRGRPQIVIGTPGRIKDHLERRTLDLSTFNIVVLDEVDRMLDMGFVNDVREILSNLAPERQSFFFSATLDSRVNDLIQTFSNDPVTISIKTGDTAENVHQDVVKFAGTSDKLEKLHDILSKPDVKAIVFDETQRSVERLSQELVARGFDADAIHGGKSQGQRQRALDRFKKNQIKILVATDVAARGIDVVDITHVINYATPQSYDDYVHRIGRAGRAGRTGYALTFVTH